MLLHFDDAGDLVAASSQDRPRAVGNDVVEAPLAGEYGVSTASGFRRARRCALGAARRPLRLPPRIRHFVRHRVSIDSRQPSSFAHTYANAALIRRLPREARPRPRVWDELWASLNGSLEQGPYQSEGAFDANTSEWVVRFCVLEAPPLKWGVLIGDVVHNLRSALDHLAWQLVLRNGGESSWRTQFPATSI